jgi:exosortase family protein XrtG
MDVNVGLLILGTLAWAGATFALRRSRRWLLFYLTGGLGFVLVVLFWASTLGLDTALEAVEAQQTVGIANLTGIALSLLGKTGLAIPNHTGWAVFDVGIECSALLEMSAIVGLIAFYPAFSAGRKVSSALIGTAVTYAVNIARIMLIVVLINAFGTSWVFAAHAVFGRVLFFFGTVALYWWLITRPTVNLIGADLGAVVADE